ncbi:hypothetical protein DPMN_115956, partial [Dreissena polymorpha]
MLKESINPYQRPSTILLQANRQEADDAASRDLSSMPCSATPLSGLTRYRANRQEADDAASRDLSSMPCSATPLIQVISMLVVMIDRRFELIGLRTNLILKVVTRALLKASKLL